MGRILRALESLMPASLSNWMHGVDPAAADKLAEANAAGTAGGDANLEFREFFAAACPHCTHLAPAWDAASKMHTGNVKFRQIMCADEGWNPVPENAELCQNIMGFPTMKMFKDGKEVEEYMGGRSKDALVQFADKWGSETKQAGMGLVGAAAAIGFAGAMDSATQEKKQESEEQKTLKSFL